MKNKVLRLAIVAVLVVAMVLSMAACDPKDPEPTTPTTPTTTTTTTTPPTTTTTTPPTTVPSGDDAALAKAAFGITVENLEGTYNGKDQYIIIKEDAAKVKDNNYTSTYTLAANYEYDGNKTGLTAPTPNAKDAALIDLYKDADGKYTETSTGNTFVGKAIKVKDAGEYTFSVAVKVADDGFGFAQFDSASDDDVDYELVVTASIKKADAQVVVFGKTEVVDEDEKLTKAPQYEAATLGVNFILMSGGKVITENVDALLTEYLGSIATNATAYLTATSTYKMNAPTSVGYKMVFGKTGLTGDYKAENDLDITEAGTRNYNVTFVDSTLNFVSAYDMNAIRDVATSVVETYYGANNTNLLTQYPLAKARFDALTEAQKVFFQRGTVVAGVGTVTAGNAGSENIANFAALAIADGGFNDSTKYNQANVIETYLNTYLPKLVAKANLIKNWETAIKDAKWDKLGAAFELDNASMVASYNAVDAYFKALSADDQKTIKAGSPLGYATYADAAGKFGEKDVKAVTELIAGAIGAYDRAIANLTVNTTVSSIYELKTETVGSVKYFINNAEVKALTAQAKTAYDKLSDTLKAEVKKVTVTPTNMWVITEYQTALAALVKMNAVVGHMEQVINHTNIENFKHLATTETLYNRLRAFVYEGSDLFGNGNFAMKDILAAYDAGTRYMDKVVAEYKAWIDTAISFNEFQKKAVADLDALIAAEFTAENEYSELQLAKALAKDGVLYSAIKAAIMTETEFEYVTTSAGNSGKILIEGTLPANFAANAGKIIANSKTTGATAESYFNYIIDQAAAGRVETHEEMKEMFVDAFDIDAAFSVFSAAYDKATKVDLI